MYTQDACVYILYMYVHKFWVPIGIRLIMCKQVYG